MSEKVSHTPEWGIARCPQCGQDMRGTDYVERLRQQRDQLAEALRYWMPDELFMIPLNYTGEQLHKWDEHTALLASLKDQEHGQG